MIHEVKTNKITTLMEICTVCVCLWEFLLEEVRNNLLFILSQFFLLFACFFLKKEMLFRRTCKLVEFENATKALEKAKPKNQEAVSYAGEGYLG